MYLLNNNLLIRNATPADAERLCAWWNDGAVMAHAGFPNGVGDTPKRIRESLAGDTDDTHRRHIIEFAGTPIGEMNYRSLGNGVAEIGIKICDAALREKGYGTTLLTMFVDALFKYFGYEKIVLDTNVKNTRAQHVYEHKLGFRKVRVRENSWTDQLGAPQSSIDYELSKAEWITKRPNADYIRIVPVDVAEEKSVVCDHILRALPSWFGIEESIVEYVEDVRGLPFFAAYRGTEAFGFAALKPHNEFTAEVSVMGVIREYHRHGVGRALIQRCVEECLRGGRVFLTVKTLDSSRASESYDKTRMFYRSMGFYPLEVFPLLWNESNPCLFMAKHLDTN